MRWIARGLNAVLISEGRLGPSPAVMKTVRQRPRRRIDGRTERVIPFSQGVLIEQKIPILVHSPTVEGPPAGIGGSASSVPRRVAPSVSEPKIPMSPAML